MRGFCGVGIYSPKTDANVGGALRAAFCFDAAYVVVQAARYRRQPTDTCNTLLHKPLFLTDDIVKFRPHDCQLVVVERLDGAKDITHYTHPDRALYVFGPEDGSVPKRIVDAANTVLQIPTRNCLNLAACVNVVLFDRVTKRARLQRRTDALAAMGRAGAAS